ncbi:EAL domain-containing protein [Neobacillus sp. FSL H8-0543]|uniref:sensor domain-containing protein n=1 Tax=Neobacillus sp. FSL H8-0543 TaxID=2954672 RepID=UPI003158A472
MTNGIKKSDLSLFIDQCEPLLKGIPLPCYILDLEGNIVFSNRAAQRLTGYKRDKANHRNFLSLLQEDGIGKTINHVNAVLKGERKSFQIPITHSSGSRMMANILSTPVEIGGQIQGICGFIIDASQGLEATPAIPGNGYENFTNTDICLWSLDVHTLGTISISPVCQSIFGYSEEEFLFDNYLGEKIIHPIDQYVVFKQRELLTKGQAVLQEYRIIRKNGEYRWISDFIIPIFDGVTNDPIRLDRIVIDITERKKAEEELTYLAYHDSLTGLPNRRKLDDDLHQLIREAQELDQIVGIVFLDLDRFKYINDSLGHKMGDKVLQIIADRLRASLRSDDIISRQGGDEFVVLLKSVKSRQVITEMAARLNQVIAEPIRIKEHVFVLRASIGISIYPDHDQEPDALIQKADQAMYLAKENGGGIQPYQAEMAKSLSRKLLLEQSLNKAIEQNELYLEYQPIVDVYQKEIIGLEALLRWKHPILGQISPGEFIPIAEETDLIITISNWVLSTACKQRRIWADQGLPPFYISVNIAARHIQRGSFIQNIKDTLDRYKLPPRLLKIEITERTAMTDVEKTLTIIKKLQDFGIDIILDDFGIGYSSISYLVQYPFNTIKIDKSFIHGLGNKNQQAVCRALVAMGRNLGMKVVAEGVETLEQYHYLCSLSCHNMQGYYFSKPTPVDKVGEFFKNQGDGSVGPKALLS